LNAKETSANIEDQVVSTSFAQRAIDIDSKLHCGKSDSRLGYRSFLIRCHIRQRSDRIGWAVSV